MSCEKVFAGVRRNSSAVKRMQSNKLRFKLIEHEGEYRKRLSKFVDAFKNSAKKSECLTPTRIKIILKTMDEVLKGSDGLLVSLDKRGSSYQPADVIYEQINAHRMLRADGLYKYCTQLQDICSLLQESCVPETDKTEGNYLHEALLPVHHVQELLDIFLEVKKDLVHNRRLVEVFSCNALIEQLTKELERMRKVIKSINAENLLVELHVMATTYNSNEIELSPGRAELSAPHQETSEQEVSRKETRQPDSLKETSLEPSPSEKSLRAVNGDGRFKITRSSNTPLSRRESKKLVRYQVQSFASKLSEMKDELFSLQRKLEELKMLSVESSSESDNECTGRKCTNSNDENTMGSYGDDTDSEVEAVATRRPSAFARIKDSQTKALLRSSMRRAPLYQNYQKFARDAEPKERSPMAEPSADDDLPETMRDDADASRPESGIVMEEGFHDGSNENMSCDGSKLEACSECTDFICDTSDYVDMNAVDFTKKYKNFREVANSNGAVHLRTCSLQDSHSDYAPMIDQNYVNIRMAPISQEKSENNNLAVQDGNGADLHQMMPTDGEFLGGLATASVVQKSTRKRTGWCQIPVVRESGVLERMTSKQRNLQEAKYELISSKVSYLKSLSIVQSVFISNENLRKLMTPTEWNDLFQLIGPIKQCSEHFLSDLLSGWPHDIFLSNQLSVVRQYAESGLQVYVDFCAHKITMDDTLKNIRVNNPEVNQALGELEREEICDGHSLESFLVLPIQRITRFPLIVEGILLRMDANSDKDFCDWAKTYQKLRVMAKKCNEAVQDAETRKVKYLRSQSSTLPSKKTSMSTFWNDQE